MSVALLVLMLPGLLLLGTPLFVVMGASVCLLIVAGGYASMTLVAQKMIDGLNNDHLRSLPVLGMATTILGWMRGGLGLVAVGACTIVASISGSGVTTALAMAAHGDVFFGISGLTAGTGSTACLAAGSQSSTSDDRGHAACCHRPCRTGGRSRWNFCHGHDKTARRFGRDVTGSHFQ